MTFELHSERLQLTPFNKRDQELLHNIFIDPHVREFLWDDEIVPESQTEEIIDINEKQFKNEYSGLWKIQLHNSHKIMGFVGLWYFFNETQPQLIFGLMPDFTGKGYATEASACITNYAFNTLDLTL